MKCKITLIIPCHNAASYLPNILKDIKEQEFSDFEVILVNDGDYEQRCLIEHAIEDNNRLRCIENKGKGVSAARNTGMAAADGEWIVFADVDDRLKPCYLKSLYDAVKMKDVELAFGEYDKVDCKTGLLTHHNIDEGLCEKRMSIKELISHTEYMRDCFRSVWGKIYNRIFIMQHGISFDETTCVAEDWEFNLRIYNHAKYVGIAKENGYVYHFGNDGSLLNEYHHEFLKRHLLCIELEKALYEKYDSSVMKTKAFDEQKAYAELCFDFLKILSSSGCIHSRNETAAKIEEQLLGNKTLMAALKCHKPERIFRKMQRLVILTRCAKLIAVKHIFLYKCKGTMRWRKKH